MNKILPIVRFGYCLFIALLLSLPLLAQTREISGKVTTSEDGSALPGVNISVKGTSRGTTTNADGDYKLTVNDGETLVFSQIGMVSQEVVIGNQSVLNISLQPSENTLDEVVVTEFGIVREKRSLAYSVVEVKGKDIAETQRANFLIALQGRVPGLTMTTTSGNPGASASINLRGVTSIGGNNSPLFVLDGLVVDNRTFAQGALVSDSPNRNNDYLNRIADLNPNDIESISVLKGAEAAALYGSQANNGAIIITTRRGSAGKGKITYDNSFRFDKVYRLLDIQKTYDRGVNSLYSSQTNSYFGPIISQQVYSDNIKNAFQVAYSQTHNFGIEGGTDKATYRLSANYVNQNGVIPNTSLDKFSVRLSSDTKITSKLKAFTTFNYVSNDLRKPFKGDGGFFTALFSMQPTQDIRYYMAPDGSRVRALPDYNSEIDNPLYQAAVNKNTDKTRRIIGNTTFNYQILPWLEIVGRAGLDIYSTLGNYFINPGSSLSYNVGTIENYAENSRILTGNFLAIAKKKAGAFDGTLTLGGSLDDKRYEVTSSKGDSLQIPTLNSLNNTKTSTQRNKQTTTRVREPAIFGALDISYKDIIYLRLTGRNDWNSKLSPGSPLNYFYPSAGLGVVVSDINPIREILPKSVNFIKTRFTYSEVGNAPPVANAIEPTLTAQVTTGGGYALGVFGGNFNLKPEKTKSIEVGGEVRFFNNRLGFDLAYFRANRFRQIVQQRLSYGTGSIIALVNMASLMNEGVELQINGTPVKTQNFTWDITLNFTNNRTYVKNLLNNVSEYYNSDTWLIGNARASSFNSNMWQFYPGVNLDYNHRGEGRATAIGGYSYLRNNKGDILINPTTGLPVTNANFLPIGDRNPDFAIGLFNRVSYKTISLSFLLDIRKGGDVFNGNEYYLFRRGLSTKTLDRNTPVVFKGVLRDGKENTETPTTNTIQINPATNNDYFSSIPESEFVEKDINWLRVRDVTLSYQLPTKWLSKTKVFNSGSIFFTGTDLFLWTNYTGVDPNVNGTTASTLGSGASGFDFGTLAVPRGYSFGIRVQL
jgi:TonB-linked SusC/RagA family outer membrane protein